MKKTMMKTILAATMLCSAIVGQGEISNAAATTPAPTTAPMDNLSKYGMKKKMELPVTLTVAGLSYTLHKVMIYDVNSSDAKSLIKRYQYWDLDSFGAAKYLIWTKITITNNSNKKVQRNSNDLNDKWYINTAEPGAGGTALPLSSLLPKHSTNSKETLHNFILKPGESLTTYQPFSTRVKPTLFMISLMFNNKSKLVFLADSKGE